MQPSQESNAQKSDIYLGVIRFGPWNTRRAASVRPALR